MGVVFVDNLTLAAVPRLLWHARSARTIWYFECSSPRVLAALAFGHHRGWLRASLHPVRGNVGDIRTSQGDNQYLVLRAQAHARSARLAQALVDGNALVQAMRPVWDQHKLWLYFARRIEEQLLPVQCRISLAAWLLETEHPGAREGRLIMASMPWDSELKACALAQGLRLTMYGRWAARGSRIARRARQWAVAVVSGMRGMRRARGRQRRTGPQRPSRPVTAIRYWHRTLSFDPADRSEFFWLPDSGTPPSEVLLYDYRTSRPLDQDTRAELERRNVRLLGQGPGVPAWRPTRRIVRVMRPVLLRLARGCLRCLSPNRVGHLAALGELIKLAVEYAYWHDFFSANHVRLNVGTINTRVAQLLALEALDGVSVAYQYSASNFLTPTWLLTSGADVQFVLSQAFERLWRQDGRPLAGAVVPTGFIYDAALEAIRQRGRPAAWRQALEARGARFVLCFFDEYSLPASDFYFSHEDAAEDYEFLLSWVLADPTVGLIVKPKNSTDLFQRIASVRPLVERAQATGRCVFLTSETIVGGVFPAEAALASDVCVGRLDGISAALEARLAGTPTVLIDTERFARHPFHAWGKGRVVFTSLPSLKSAIEQYRASPASHPEFGDWSPGLADLDPFCDGQGTRRLGTYIGWLHDALARGASKQEALAFAAERHARECGAGAAQPLAGAGRS